MIKKIAILTSGGDSQGMNSVIRAATRVALKAKLEVILIKNGYLGLVKNDVITTETKDVADIINLGGTIIGAKRLPEFEYDTNIQKKIINNLKQNNIDALIVIGGNGTFLGAYKLVQAGIKVIGIPATIDNDVDQSDFTVGFDTALNIIVESIDRIRTTTKSHSRTTVVEVMGRDCGMLALYASIASGCDVISIPEVKLSQKEIVDEVLHQRNVLHKKSVIVIITEMMYDINDLCFKIEKATKVKCRPTILGHIQRGGAPSAYDRILAARFGFAAIKNLLNNVNNCYLTIAGNKIKAIPINNNEKYENKIVSKLLKINKTIT